MNLQAVIRRELLVNARDPSLHRSRTTTATIGLVWVSVLYLVAKAVSGLFPIEDTFFQIISGIVFVMCAFVGAGLTCDAVSSEKREGTLGLLFLTPLKPFDIIWAKFMAKSLRGFCELLCTFPILAATFLFGAVSPAEFWKIVLTLVATLFFSTAAGLAVSPWNERSRLAASSAGAVIFFFTFALPLLGDAAARMRLPETISFGLRFLGLGYTFQMAFDATAGMRHHLFWWSLGKTVLLGFGLMLFAGWSLAVRWQDSPSTPKGDWAGTWARVKLGPAEWRLARRLARLKVNAFYWLASRERFAASSAWIVFAAGVLFTAGYWVAYGQIQPTVAVTCTWVCSAAMVFHFVVKIAAAATERLTEDRESGALEVILATPIQARDVANGLWRALASQFGLPAMFIFAFGGIATAVLPDDQGRKYLLAFWILFFGMLPALIWTGMWMALRSSPPRAASAASFLRVVIFPGFLWLIVVPLWRGVGLDTRLALAYYLSLLNSVVIFILARHRFLTRFRATASEAILPTERKRWRFQWL